MTKNPYRSHNCGELRKSDINSEVILSGWVHRKRDHGGIMFIDLRDDHGITQIVVSQNIEELKDAFCTSNESVIRVYGTVTSRSSETINTKIPTGDIEILAKSINILSKADVLPFQVNGDDGSEDQKLEYRFLSLRRDDVHQKIILRSEVINHIREKMRSMGFREFQTPILTASSPEGARDFLVPTRDKGKFYALPQAPQQFKQFLMISGFDRYFQIAPCFRDEDPRADRSPGEFYQLDIEMSFATQDEVFEITENVVHDVFKRYSRPDTTTISDKKFVRIDYEDSMLKYGTDKPDLRNPIKISDVTDIFSDSNFKTFSEAVKKGMKIRAIPAPSASNMSRSFFDDMISFAQTEANAKGLAYIIINDENSKGPVAKFLTKEQINDISKRANLKNGDAVFFACEMDREVNKIAGKVRQKLGEVLDLIDEKAFSFCWIVNFPMYEWSESEEKIDFSHNPFSMPQGGIDAINSAKNDEDILKIKAYQYDLVCNGIELSSGAIRNHDLNILKRAFEIAGYTTEELESNFKGMVKALKYGAPPHGGIAPGVDRIIMLLLREENIRDVIAFPLNQRGCDLLLGAPNYVKPSQLKELGLKLQVE